MSFVYSLMILHDHEGGTLEGVFSTQEEAKKYVRDVYNLTGPWKADTFYPEDIALRDNYTDYEIQGWEL